jgi:hypothetical protein
MVALDDRGVLSLVAALDDVGIEGSLEKPGGVLEAGGFLLEDPDEGFRR